MFGKFNLGNLTQSLFGGSRSSSNNKAYDQIKSSFSPLLGYAQEGGNLLSKLLGGDASGFDAYKRAVGFDPIAERGARGVTGSAAAGGLLRSGASGMALQRYGQEIQNQYAQDYMKNLLGLTGIGSDAGRLLTSAGQTSKSRQESGGLGKALGGFFGGLGG